MNCVRCKKREAFKSGKICSICIIRAMKMPAISLFTTAPNISEVTKEIPSQYRHQAEDLIYDIGKLADKLYPIISELGDNLEIEGTNCLVVIEHKPKDSGGRE